MRLCSSFSICISPPSVNTSSCYPFLYYHCSYKLMLWHDSYLPLFSATKLGCLTGHSLKLMLQEWMNFNVTEENDRILRRNMIINHRQDMKPQSIFEKQDMFAYCIHTYICMHDFYVKHSNYYSCFLVRPSLSLKQGSY